MPPADTPESFHEWDPYGPTLTVIVGQEPYACTFAVSQTMLCHYSAYFKFMSGDFLLPDIDNTVRLPGDNPEILKMAINYFHQRCFIPAPDGEQERVMTFDKLIEIYAFATKRGMPVIQNHAVDIIFAKVGLGYLPDRWSMEYLWERTIPGCKLRKVMVALVRAMWIPERYKDPIWVQLQDGTSEDPERLYKLMEELCESGHTIRTSDQMKRRLLSCEWHVHYNGGPCEGAEEFILNRGYRAEAEPEGMERGGRGPHVGIRDTVSNS